MREEREVNVGNELNRPLFVYKGKWTRPVQLNQSGSSLDHVSRPSDLGFGILDQSNGPDVFGWSRIHAGLGWAFLFRFVLNFLLFSTLLDAFHTPVTLKNPLKILKNFLCVLDLFLDIFVMCYVLNLVCGIFLQIVTILIKICGILYSWTFKNPLKIP
jgi:hypothetical protein